MYKRNRHSAEITYAHQNRAALANAAPAETIEPEITITPIGSIDQGIDGKDEYVLLTRKDDDLDADTAHNWLLPQVYRESLRPGGYFCTSVGISTTDQPNKVIAVIHHRYDV